MEVSGKKAQKHIKLCKPCEGRNVTAYAGGFCQQCSEHMCKSCFDTHKQFKLNRGHQWDNADDEGSSGEQLEDYDLCDKHSSEPIKFFCPRHDCVGCGDCMILDHKSCKVEYIRDLLNAFRESKEYKEFGKDVEENYNAAKKMKSCINNNKDQIKDVNKMFKRDVNKFKDELIAHITKLTNALLRYGDDIMSTDLKTMDSLEKENECLISDTSRIKDTLRSLTKKPYKTFITSVQYKKKLHQFQDQLGRIKGKDNFERYAFKRDTSLDQILHGSQDLGYLQKSKLIDKTEKQTTESRQTDEKKMPVSQQMCQPLLQRQKLCKNLNIDGKVLSFAGSEQGGVGLYISNEELSVGKYLEIEILGLGRNGSIAIGTVTSTYQDNVLPGSGLYSFGYHSDGKVYYNGHDPGVNGQKWTKGDSIRCTIKNIAFKSLWVSFNHNGREIYGGVFSYGRHFAVSMKSEGDKVKVMI